MIGFKNVLSMISVCLCAICPAFHAHAANIAEKLWTPQELSGTPKDLERRPGRDLMPPEPRAPRESLAPLPEAEDGVIRRVRPTSDRKLVALTFDACELATGSSGYEYRIVDFLRREKIPATFFMGGKWMRSHQERAMQIMADPLFEIANHAWSHGNFAIMDEQTAREQILWTEAQYETTRSALASKANAAGLDAALMDAVPRHMSLFRLPYGRSSPKSLRLLGSLGFKVIQWDVVPELPGDNSGSGLAAQAASRVRPGSIILFHVNAVPKMSNVLLENLVTLLRAKGYNFLTVSELLTTGPAETAKDGYFSKPGDNAAYDHKFGKDGTGAR